MSAEHPFYRLAPFIQEYIYRSGWEELREVQVEASRVILDTNHHMLIASGTASGKTEAAFFPALTLLDQEPSSSVGILYIGPLKALINDQFQRLEGLMRDANIPVWHWHGDVPQSEKTKVMRRPSGVLQITPESLEGLLMNRPNAIPALFGDLRFIVIDEVHAFMGADRGSQVLSQLERLSRMAGCRPRRIGLSATLGDYESVKDWLAGGTHVPVELVSPPGGRKLRLSIENFAMPDARDERQSEALENAKKSYNNFVYDHTHLKKALIFTNSRTTAETTILEMRRIAAMREQPDVFHVHHGSISSMLREEAETALREGYGPAVAAATLTLELGIDLGSLERVMQLGAPYSCASFVQRLGRSGRREGSVAEMMFVCAEEDDEEAQLPARMPWTLLRAIAVCELYVKEKWIEPQTVRQLPLGLLYHQTMSVLRSFGEAEAGELARAVLTLPPFAQFTTEQYRELLEYLLATDHIEQTEDGNLIVGMMGERVSGHYRFYAVFKDEEEHVVYDGSEEIGSITTVPPAGYCFSLAGRLWKVDEVDNRHKAVYVKNAKGKADTLWLGAGGDMHTRILRKMREILRENTLYPYLAPNAAARLERARRLSRETGLTERLVLPAGGDSMFIMPWIGSREFRTLERLLKNHLSQQLSLRSVVPMEPHYMVVAGRTDADELQHLILSESERMEDPLALLDEFEAPYLGKYDEFTPPSLIRAAFAADGLDLDGLRRGLRMQDRR